MKTPEDAVAVVLMALNGQDQEETVVLLLDRRHRGRVCLVIDGLGDIVESVESLVVQAAGPRTDDQHGAGAVVLATSRPSRGHLPTAADEMRWFELRERFGELGIDLLDWFILSDGRAGSMAELTDCRSLWLGAGPD